MDTPAAETHTSNMDSPKVEIIVNTEMNPEEFKDLGDELSNLMLHSERVGMAKMLQYMCKLFGSEVVKEKLDNKCPLIEAGLFDDIDDLKKTDVSKK